MRRWMVVVGVALFLAVLCGAALAQATPQYIPCECYLSPENRDITKDSPTALFHGEWYEGATGTYHVTITYGDGTYESFNTTSHSSDFYHHYNTSGKSPGYQWTVTLSVSNGNTDYDTSTVTLR